MDGAASRACGDKTGDGWITKNMPYDERTDTGMYHMKLAYALDVSDPGLNAITELVDGTHVVLHDAGTCTIELTADEIPDETQLKKYADAIVASRSPNGPKIESARFSHYAMIERMPGTMTCARAKQIAFEVIQLIRQERERKGHDPNDTDDVLFSELDVEIGELEELFKPYGIRVYGGSCFEDGQSPKDYDRKHFPK